MKPQQILLCLVLLSFSCAPQEAKVLAVSTVLTQLPFLQVQTTQGTFLFLVDTGCSQTWVSDEFTRAMDLPTTGMESSSIAYPVAERMITSNRRLSDHVSADLPVPLTGAFVVDSKVAEEYSRQWEDLVSEGKARFAGVVGLDSLKDTRLVFSPHSFQISSRKDTLPHQPVGLTTIPLRLSNGHVWLNFGDKQLSHPPVMVDTGTAQDMVTIQPTGTAQALQSSVTTVVNGREWNRVHTPRWDQWESVLPSTSFWISLDTRPTFLLGTAFLREFCGTLDFSSQTLLISGRRADYASSALLNAYY